MNSIVGAKEAILGVKNNVDIAVAAFNKLVGGGHQLELSVQPPETTVQRKLASLRNVGIVHKDRNFTYLNLLKPNEEVRLTEKV